MVCAINNASQTPEIKEEVYRGILSGLVTGTVGSFVSYPFKSVKEVHDHIPKQLHVHPGDKTIGFQISKHPYQGILKTIRPEVLSKTAALSIYPVIKDIVAKKLELNPNATNFVSGAALGPVASAFEHLGMQFNRENNHVEIYTNYSRHSYESLKSTFRKFKTNTYYQGVLFGIFFGLSELYQSKDPLESATIGGVAGAVAAKVAHPLKNILENQMHSPHAQSTAQTALKILQNKGSDAFYKNFFKNGGIQLAVAGAIIKAINDKAKQTSQN